MVASSYNNDNGSQVHPITPLTLDRLAIGQPARILAVDWPALVPAEARRLQEFGLDIGVTVEALHRGSLFSRDPLAVMVGKMRVVLRGAHAAAFTVLLNP
ncbi:MAG: FeoA family protein [Sphingopyxis sp.]